MDENVKRELQVIGMGLDFLMQTTHTVARNALRSRLTGRSPFIGASARLTTALDYAVRHGYVEEFQLPQSGPGRPVVFCRPTRRMDEIFKGFSIPKRKLAKDVFLIEPLILDRALPELVELWELDPDGDIFAQLSEARNKLEAREIIDRALDIGVFFDEGEGRLLKNPEHHYWIARVLPHSLGKAMNTEFWPTPVAERRERRWFGSADAVLRSIVERGGYFKVPGDETEYRLEVAPAVEDEEDKFQIVWFE